MSQITQSSNSSRIWPKLEPIQALMHVLITCKYQKDRIKTTEKSAVTSFSHYMFISGDSLDICSCMSALADIRTLVGPIWPTFELIQYIMHVLVTSKFQRIGSTDPEKKWTDDLSLDVQ